MSEVNVVIRKRRRTGFRGSDLRRPGQALHRRGEGEDRGSRRGYHRDRRHPGCRVQRHPGGLPTSVPTPLPARSSRPRAWICATSVIYDLLDEVKQAMSGMLAPEYRQEIIGLAEVPARLQVAEVWRRGRLYGHRRCGQGSNRIRVLRDNVVIYEGELESLRRFSWMTSTKSRTATSAASRSRTTTTCAKATRSEVYETVGNPADSVSRALYKIGAAAPLSQGIEYGQRIQPDPSVGQQIQQKSR